MEMKNSPFFNFLRFTGTPSIYLNAFQLSKAVRELQVFSQLNACKWVIN
jgi:hypothetical protein